MWWFILLFTDCSLVANQNQIQESGAIVDLIDVISQYSKDYMANPKESLEKGQALLAAVGTIHALTTKNGT